MNLRRKLQIFLSMVALVFVFAFLTVPLKDNAPLVTLICVILAIGNLILGFYPDKKPRYEETTEEENEFYRQQVAKEAMRTEEPVTAERLEDGTFLMNGRKYLRVGNELVPFSLDRSQKEESSELN